MHNEKHPARCAACPQGTQPSHRLAGRAYPKRCLADGNLRDDVGAISNRVEHSRSERSLVEGDCSSGVIDP